MSPLSTPHNTPPPPLLSFSCERPSKRRSAHFSILGTPCTYHAVNPSANPKRFRIITSCAGSFNCPFLVFSVVFSQVLTLHECYVLKQSAEIFAAFRSISQLESVRTDIILQPKKQKHLSIRQRFSRSVPQASERIGKKRRSNNACLLRFCAVKCCERTIDNKVKGCGGVGGARVVLVVWVLLLWGLCSARAVVAGRFSLRLMPYLVLLAVYKDRYYSTSKRNKNKEL